MSIKGFSVSGVTDRYDYNYLDNKPEIHSIPTGGTAGQVLAKRSGADYAVEWADQTGGGGDITVDDVLSNTSENPVQNKVITAALATKADQAGIQQVIEDEVDDWLSVQAPSIGTLSYAAKQALLACFRKVAWIDNQGQSYYNALESELFPNTTLESITAVFTQGSATIYDTDSLDTLRQYLVVTANYSDSTTAVVTNYTLSGTLAEGTSTITVSYSGKTDTFNVTVTNGIRIPDGDFTFSDGTTINITNNHVLITLGSATTARFINLSHLYNNATDVTSMSSINNQSTNWIQLSAGDNIKLDVTNANSSNTSWHSDSTKTYYIAVNIRKINTADSILPLGELYPAQSTPDHSRVTNISVNATMNNDTVASNLFVYIPSRYPSGTQITFDVSIVVE